MPTVDFYILNDDNPNAHWLFACRLLQKAYQQQHQVYVHTTNTQDSEKINDLLWTFSDTSFVPHRLLDTNSTSTPIVIGQSPTAPANYEILLNLSKDIPNYYDQFKRILEIVPAEPTLKSQSRQHFQFYKDHNCEVSSHKISHT